MKHALKRVRSAHFTWRAEDKENNNNSKKKKKRSERDGRVRRFGVFFSFSASVKTGCDE